MAAANTDRDWVAKYRNGETPWDSKRPSRELLQVLSETKIPAGRAIELGCGTGTNAIALAKLGWEVTAVDCVPEALEEGRKKEAAAGVEINWIEDDVVDFGADLKSFDFVFDRGCYHCCRRVNLTGYLNTLRNVTHIGSYMLCLCGNPNDQEYGGPPRVPEEKVREEFGTMFDILHLRPFHFEDEGGLQGPLGWSAWMQRKQ